MQLKGSRVIQRNQRNTTRHMQITQLTEHVGAHPRPTHHMNYAIVDHHHPQHLSKGGDMCGQGIRGCAIIEKEITNIIINTSARVGICVGKA